MNDINMYPSMEDLKTEAYRDGFECGRLGDYPSDNPWEIGTKDYNHWETGRRAGKRKA